MHNLRCIASKVLDTTETDLMEGFFFTFTMVLYPNFEQTFSSILHENYCSEFYKKQHI